MPTQDNLGVSFNSNITPLTAFGFVHNTLALQHAIIRIRQTAKLENWRVDDIIVLASLADFNNDGVPILKEGTAGEALWRGLHTCGFEAIAVEAALPVGTAMEREFP